MQLLIACDMTEEQQQVKEFVLNKVVVQSEYSSNSCRPDMVLKQHQSARGVVETTVQELISLSSCLTKKQVIAVFVVIVINYLFVCCLIVGRYSVFSLESRISNLSFVLYFISKTESSWPSYVKSLEH